ENDLRTGAAQGFDHPAARRVVVEDCEIVHAETEVLGADAGGGSCGFGAAHGGDFVGWQAPRAAIAGGEGGDRDRVAEAREQRHGAAGEDLDIVGMGVDGQNSGCGHWCVSMLLTEHASIHHAGVCDRGGAGPATRYPPPGDHPPLRPPGARRLRNVAGRPSRARRRPRARGVVRGDRLGGGPASRLSGQRWGGLLTEWGYRDWKRVVEFRWGAVTWGERGDRARDSGSLLHCQGGPGSSQKEFNGPWMRSIEFQMIEGGTGDLLVLSGYGDNGELFRASVKANVRKARNGPPVFVPTGPPARFSSGRINWPGRSEDWAGRLGFRGANDVERPLGEWNRLEAIIEGGNLTYYVNGKLVNQATEATLTEG